MAKLNRSTSKSHQSETTFQPADPLQGNEWVLKSIYLQAPMAMEIFDADGKLLDINPACLDLFGIHSVDEVRGFDLFSDPNISVEDRERLAKGERVAFESVFDFDLVRQKRLYKTSRTGLCFIECQIMPIKKAGEALTGYFVHVRDITERKQFAQALEQSEKYFRSLIEYSADAISLVDAKGLVTYESPSTQRLTGYSPQERLGKSGFGLIYPDDLPNVQLVFGQMLASPGQVVHALFRSVRKDGTVWWTEGSAINLLKEPGVQAVIINYRDVTERINAENALREMNEQLNIRVAEIEELHNELRQQALRDPLTGLYNRRHLADALERELARVTREKSPLSIIIMDIDRFKRINDTYGHQTGDQFLKMIANLIAGHSRTSDIACRYGGEEFLLVLPGTAIKTAATRAEELRIQCHNIRIPYKNKNLKVTMSLGVASYPKHGDTAEDIVIKADKALYQSKQQGRNRVSVWSETLEHNEPNPEDS